MSVDDIVDPFAGADADADEFATPQTEYLGLADLEGRLLVIDVLKVETARGVDGDYEFAKCNVVVVDGAPMKFLPAVPGVIKGMHINAKGVMPQIEGYAGTGKPFLCRPDVIENKRKQRVAGVRRNEITNADKDQARPAWRAYKTGELG